MKKKVFGFDRLSDLICGAMHFRIYDEKSDLNYMLNCRYPHIVKDNIVYYLDSSNMSAIAYIPYRKWYSDFKIAQTVLCTEEEFNEYIYHFHNDEEPLEPGEYTIKYVYVRNDSWETISLPNTVEDVVIDRCIDESNNNSRWRHDSGGRFSLTEGNKYLSVTENGSLYTKNKKRLISLYYEGEQILSTVKEIDTYAIPSINLKKLVIPKGIKSFDCNKLLHYACSVKQVEFEGPLKELTTKEDLRTIEQYNINNTIDKVKIDNMSVNDIQLDNRFKFQPSIGGSYKSGEITLTLAGANEVPGRSNAYYKKCQKWSAPITISIDFIAAIYPVTLDCYEQHEGCKLMLLGACMEYLLKRELTPYINVYEPYDTVMKLLHNAGWNKEDSFIK